MKPEWNNADEKLPNDYQPVLGYSQQANYFLCFNIQGEWHQTASNKTLIPEFWHEIPSEPEQV